MRAPLTLHLAQKPKDYRPPSWSQVETLHRQLKVERKPRIDQTNAVKRARRNDWNETVQKLPSAYRNLPIVVGDNDIPEMIKRVTGIIAKGEPIVEVMPPSGRQADIHKASKEEARLNAVRIGIQDQQDRDVWLMGIDSQAANGESWISVWPETDFFDERYKRGEDEDADAYSKRFRHMQTEDGIPIRLEDHDPQTICYVMDRRQRLSKVIIESQHSVYEIEDEFGYEAKQSVDGEKPTWHKKLLGEARVTDENAVATSNTVDVTHDTRNTGMSSSPRVKSVTRVIYMDRWCTVVFLDGQKVETHQHNYGCVNMFPAFGLETSDRDPAWKTQGVADAALVIAKQMVFFSAVLASNAYHHGFPTPFLKNPGSGAVDPKTGIPLARPITFGQMNVLGPQEEIIFPMLNAQMGPDFLKAMDMLSGKLNDATLGGFNKALGTEMAGYALAQVRSMQMAVLGSLYRNATRQWRKIYYFLRHVVKNELKGGITLRGAVDETDDGDQFRPILTYGPEDCTEFAIDVHIPEGVVQDEMAENKMGLEMLQAGVWSKRRVMERSGVEDPAAEMDEISTDRLMGSEAADQLVLTLAQSIIAQRQQAVTQTTNTPFNQALEAAKGNVMGNQPGMPVTQGGQPQNALPGGQPMQQNPAVSAPQQGGPTAGPSGNLEQFGIPGIPGGVKGGNGPQQGAG